MFFLSCLGTWQSCDQWGYSPAKIWDNKEISFVDDICATWFLVLHLNICYDTSLQVWWCCNNNKIKDGNEDPEKFKDKSKFLRGFGLIEAWNLVTQAFIISLSMNAFICWYCPAMALKLSYYLCGGNLNAKTHLCLIQLQDWQGFPPLAFHMGQLSWKSLKNKNQIYVDTMQCTYLTLSRKSRLRFLAGGKVRATWHKLLWTNKDRMSPTKIIIQHLA